MARTGTTGSTRTKDQPVRVYGSACSLSVQWRTVHGASHEIVES